MDPNYQQPQQPMGDSQPAGAPVAEPQAVEKCETCGKDSANGSCVACNMPNASCTCEKEPAEEAGNVGGVEPQPQPAM